MFYCTNFTHDNTRGFYCPPVVQNDACFFMLGLLHENIAVNNNHNKNSTRVDTSGIGRTTCMDDFLWFKYVGSIKQQQ